jgi:DNA-binding IclR family transcriptional regulator
MTTSSLAIVDHMADRRTWRLSKIFRQLSMDNENYHLQVSRLTQAKLLSSDVESFHSAGPLQALVL